MKEEWKLEIGNYFQPTSNDCNRFLETDKLMSRIDKIHILPILLNLQTTRHCLTQKFLIATG